MREEECFSKKCIEKHKVVCGVAYVLETSREKSLGSVQNSYQFLYSINDVKIFGNQGSHSAS